MTTKKTVSGYAISVHGQPNTNLNHADLKVDWDKCNNASSIDGKHKPKGKAVSYYKKSNKKVKKPWTLSAHNFQLNIPDCAYINKVTFQVRMKVEGEINVKAPYARFNIYNGTKYIETYTVDDTGWDDGYWYYNPNARLTGTWNTYDYVISGKEFYKRGYPISSLKKSIMGVDLRFYSAKNQSNVNEIDVDYVKCIVEYELPDHKITFDEVTSEDNPRVVDAGEEFKFKVVYQNRSNAGCCDGVNKQIKVGLPPHTVVDVINGDYVNGIWTVRCTPNSKSVLELKLKSYYLGEYPISLSNKDIGDYTYWTYFARPSCNVGDIHVSLGVMQQGVMSCVHITGMCISNYGEYILDTTLNEDISPEDVVWTVEGNPEVTISDPTHLILNIPVNKLVEFKLKGCYVPPNSGQKTCILKDEFENIILEFPYTVLPAPSFVITNKPTSQENNREVMEIPLSPSNILFQTHRVASSTDIQAYVIDCGVADYDKNTVVDECNLTASTWEKINYIGCVPLKYPHYDPKSTFENKLIDKSYKNKTYMGKEGVIEEDITLQFKTPRQDVTTLQGLVELDKPTPINANHKCFEGDALNHRGWVVLSKIEAEQTNPLWYDVDAKVKYITHDINTKFQIFKGLPVNNVPMPDMVVETFGLGDNLSEGLELFNIDTDGGFIYDDDGEDGAKNIFSLDEGQHLSISTRKPLTNVANLRFDWYSNRINELRENNINRIFILKDKTGNHILEYEYTDFNFANEYVTCTVIIRYLNKNGAWETITLENVDLKTELEADPVTVDNNENIGYEGSNSDDEYVEFVDDNGDPIIWTGATTSLTINNITYTGLEILSYFDSKGYNYLSCVEGESLKILNEGYDNDESNAYTPGYIAPSFNPSSYDLSLLYGSSLQFELNNTILKLTDSGYSGREVYKEIELVKGEYFLEALWTNANHDGTTEDVISYIDIALEETVFNTQYVEQYKDLIVSPFPIPNKKVVFTRESREGSIYYLTGEEPFKYMLEPFYQYYCGTDLVTREGISIFNLNNSYTYFYIENGLVRLGFNKYNGSLYLAKYDNINKKYVTTTYLHMSNDIKFSLAKYSDDEITIKAGNDTYFTIWRGHPYIKIKNPTDEIYFDSHFNYCYGDCVDGYAYDYSLIHTFMNTDNLLPSCIGSKSLNTKCVSVDDDLVTTGTNHTITLNAPTHVTALEDVTLTVGLTPATNDGEVHYLVDDVDVATVTAPFSFTGDLFKEGDKTYTVQAVYTGDDDDNIAISDKLTVIAEAPEPAENSYAHNGTPESQQISGKYNLKIIHAPKKFKYKDYLLNHNQQVVIQLTRGGTPMPNMVVEVQRPDGRTSSQYTDSNGKIYIPNNSSEYVPGKYQWGGRFYDEIDEDKNGKVLSKALKWISIDKATPKFTHNASLGKVNKGKSFVVKLNGMNCLAGISNIGLTGKKVTYTVNGGSKKTKTTNSNGNIHIPCNTKGVKKIKLYFAGTKRYGAIKKTFTIKVV